MLTCLIRAVSHYAFSLLQSSANKMCTDTSTNRAIWSGVEICAAILCANLATIRPILRFLFNEKSLSAVKPGSTSKASASNTRRCFHRRWTWRTVTNGESKSKTNGHFYRLDPQVGTMSRDDVESQKYEGYNMSPMTSPINSLR